jgi:hypothetical protein
MTVDELAAIRAEKAFAKLPPADRKRVLAGLFETTRSIEFERRQDRYGDRAPRLRNRDAMKTHLRPILKILDDDVGAFDAADWLVGYHQGYVFSAMAELKAFRETAQRLLAGAIEFEPWPFRAGQLRTELMCRAFYELIETLESVGVHVGATGGKGGPGSRLLCRLIAYATGSEPDPESVKVLVQQRRRSK